MIFAFGDLDGVQLDAVSWNLAFVTRASAFARRATQRRNLMPLEDFVKGCGREVEPVLALQFMLGMSGIPVPRYTPVIGAALLAIDAVG